nr:MAG: hypothetical protein [Bacteriophage sp.]
MRIAGVYASAFLLSLPNILFLFFILQVQRRETKIFFLFLELL